MSSGRKKKRRADRKSVQTPPIKQYSIVGVALFIAVIVGSAILVFVYLRSTGRSRPANPGTAAPTTQPTAPSEKAGTFENIIGHWLRPDGGYIIDIRSIRADGRVDAAYFNPRAINVARAQASWKQGTQEVYIELQDTGYPGSTYTLEYRPDQDILIGVYFQAAMNQAFEVVFIRKR
jgi:hypothetical protein